MSVDNGVFAVSGYAVSIRVERGQLVVTQGSGSQRETHEFSRIDRDLKRLIVLGHSGTVTLDALRWLTDISAAFVHIDNDGTLITVGVPGQLNDIRVRRGQAYSAVNGIGLDVVRELLADKIHGQQQVGERLRADPDLMSWMRDAEAVLPDSHTITDLRLVEARAAAAYWQAWEGVEVHFPRTEHARVPKHWRHYDARHSVLSNSPRKASNPVNALLNYLYAILEAEARIALRLVGADPGMGLLHLDNPRRESFALDLMEPVRPQVDEYVLELVTDHTFSRSDFFETRGGVCRLMPSVAQPMAATSPRWAQAVAPYAERMAGRFAAASEHLPTAGGVEAPPLPERFRTPLTQHNRRLARGGRPAPVRSKPLKSVCRRCGKPLGNLERTYCAGCRDSVRAEKAAKGRAKLKKLRAEGCDGRSSSSARRQRSRAAARNNREIAAWDEGHGGNHDPEVFRREIAPGLRYLKGRELADATGLSLVYCNQVRRGQRLPHPRHWAALRELANASGAPRNTDPEYYRTEILPKLEGFTPQEIADATGMSVSYAKRVRRGTRMPGVRWWGELEELVRHSRTLAS